MAQNCEVYWANSKNDYEYENLGWINNNHDLSFVTTSEQVNPGRSGSYAADGSYRTALANKTPNKIFEHIDSLLDDITTTDNGLNRELWGTFFSDTTRTDSHGIFAGSSAKVPGLVIGHDWIFSTNSFGGVAIAYTWPEYKQGPSKSDGKDIRLNFYGGTLIHDDWYLGYLASAGFGDLKHTRTILNDSHNAKYDTKNYSIGFSLAKNYAPWKNNIVKPFMSYEYIVVKTDGYHESDNANKTGISSSSHRENVSRLKAGSQWIHEFNTDSNLKWSLYYQGLFGDRSSNNVTSYLNIDSNHLVSVPTEDVSQHSLGTYLAWNMQLTPTTQFTLAYTGVFGKRSISNDFGINFEYKF